MPGLDFMRGMLGVLALGCLYMLARTLVAHRRGAVKISKVYGWVLRAAVCLAAVWYRHGFDTITIGVYVLAAAVFAIGYWDASRERKREDLSGQIFPE